MREEEKKHRDDMENWVQSHCTAILPCSAHVLPMFCACSFHGNLLSYYGLVDARISASEKDSPVSN